MFLFLKFIFFYTELLNETFYGKNILPFIFFSFFYKETVVQTTYRHNATAHVLSSSVIESL